MERIIKGSISDIPTKLAQNDTLHPSPRNSAKGDTQTPQKHGLLARHRLRRTLGTKMIKQPMVNNLHFELSRVFLCFHPVLKFSFLRLIHVCGWGGLIINVARFAIKT